jgi:hypothetical protein
VVARRPAHAAGALALLPYADGESPRAARRGGPRGAGGVRVRARGSRASICRRRRGFGRELEALRGPGAVRGVMVGRQRRVRDWVRRGCHRVQLFLLRETKRVTGGVLSGVRAGKRTGCRSATTTWALAEGACEEGQQASPSHEALGLYKSARGWDPKDAKCDGLRGWDVAESQSVEGDQLHRDDWRSAPFGRPDFPGFPAPSATSRPDLWHRTASHGPPRSLDGGTTLHPHMSTCYV